MKLTSLFSETFSDFFEISLGSVMTKDFEVLTEASDSLPEWRETSIPSRLASFFILKIRIFHIKGQTNLLNKIFDIVLI